MTPREDHFLRAVEDVRVGRPTDMKIRVSGCRYEFIHRQQLWMSEPITHRAAQVYSATGGLQIISTRCGQLLRYEIQEADVETVERFCDTCLMADTSVVYTFRSADGEPLYVGQSSTPLARIQQHKQSAPWWFWAASAEAQVVEPYDANRVELATIRALKPSYNRMGAA